MYNAIDPRFGIWIQYVNHSNTFFNVSISYSFKLF